MIYCSITNVNKDGQMNNKNEILALFSDMQSEGDSLLIENIFDRVFTDKEFSYNTDAQDDLFLLKVLKVLNENRISEYYGLIVSGQTNEKVLDMCKRKINAKLSFVRGVNASLRRTPDVILVG